MTDSVPILDRKRFSLLRLPPGTVESEADSLASLVSSFASSSAATLDQMRAAAAAGDGSAIAELAHRLKGASAMFGATRLRVACGEIEEAARSSANAAELQARLGDLTIELDAAHAAMTRELDP